MRIRRPGFCVAVTAIAVGLVVVGCGGSSNGGDEARATAEGRQRCLQSREGGLWDQEGMVEQEICKRFGVTRNSPSPQSLEARRASQRAQEEERRTEKKGAEEPASEKVKRLAALSDLSGGRRTQAERELEEGCPKADSAEISQAWRKLKELARAASESEMRGQEGVKALEELCPL